MSLTGTILRSLPKGYQALKTAAGKMGTIAGKVGRQAPKVGKLAARTALKVGGKAFRGLKRTAMGAAKWVGGIVGGWVANTLLNITAVSLLAFVYLGARTIYNFNFNATDKQLDAQIKGMLANLYGITGDVIGTALGWLVGGVLPGTILFCINPAMGAVIFGAKNAQTGKWEGTEFTDNMKEEIMSRMTQLCYGCFTTLQNVLLFDFYKNARRWIKSENPVAREIMIKAIGKEAFDKWGTEEAKPWSIAANVVEASIEGIKDPAQKNFVENLYESFMDSLNESGMAIAGAADQYYAQQRLTRQSPLGEPRRVEIDFNPS